MKIVYIYHSMNLFGGIERILTDKIRYLSEQEGFEVYMLTYEQGSQPCAYPFPPKAMHIDLNVSLDEVRKYTLVKRLWLRFFAEKRFRNAFRANISQIQPDIVIGTNLGVDIKHIIDLPPGVIKIIECHSSFSSFGKKQTQKRNLFRYCCAILSDHLLYKRMSQCDALVALTHADAKCWRSTKQAVVIPNMLTNDSEQLSSPPKTGKRVLSVGRLSIEKGYDMLIEAWKIIQMEHPDWALDIYGEGDERWALQQQIKDAHLETTVVLHGASQAVYQKYQESDFLVLSSRYESFGLVLIEAMSCGIPCVSFNCPSGPAEIIKDKEDGLIAESGNVADLAAKIKEMIEHPDERLRMGALARENVKRFLPGNVMPQWIKLFNHLLELCNNKRAD